MKKFLVCLLAVAVVFSMSALSFAGENEGVDSKAAENDVMAPVTIAALPAIEFKDVNDSAWYFDAVYWAVKNGITSGLSATRFGPTNVCTRGQIAAMLYRAEGEPALLDMTEEGSYNELNAFNDIYDGDYYYKAVLWAKAAGIIEGTGNNKFKPNAAMTKEQLAKLIYSYAEYKGFDMTLGEDLNILDYDDIFDTAEYAIPAFQWCIATDVMQPVKKLGSKKNVTRAEFVTILYRTLTTDLEPVNITAEELAGDYCDSFSKSGRKATMNISEPNEDGDMKIVVSYATNSFDCQVWKMTGSLYKNAIGYSDCAAYDYLFDDEIEADKVLYYIIPTEENIVGYFVVKKDGSIVWEGAPNEEQQNLTFFKMK